MSNFAENLRRVMFTKRLKAIDVARGTNITPSVISRYLSGINQPSRDNLFAVANYLGVSSEWLLSSPEAPELKKPVHNITPHQDKIIELLERMVAEKDEQIISLKAEIKQWEDWKASSKDRHARGKAKADRAIAKDKKRKPKK